MLFLVEEWFSVAILFDVIALPHDSEEFFPLGYLQWASWRVTLLTCLLVYCGRKLSLIECWLNIAFTLVVVLFSQKRFSKWFLILKWHATGSTAFNCIILLNLYLKRNVLNSYYWVFWRIKKFYAPKWWWLYMLIRLFWRPWGLMLCCVCSVCTWVISSGCVIRTDFW